MIDPKIELIRDGATLNLHEMQHFIRLQEDGLGLPDVRRLTERGPSQHGDTDVGYRLEPRVVNLVVGTFGSEDISYWELRRALQRMLKPSASPLSLRYTLPNGEVRQLDVTYAGGLSWPSNDRYVESHKAAFQLRAADPTFYDPEWRSVPFAIAASGGNWAIPHAIPWQIGSSTIDQSQAVNNFGDWQSYPIITIQGPISSPVLRNETTGEKLDFSGYSVTSGTTITIDTRYGIKSVRDQSGNNLISKLTSDSDLATFHLAADPDAPGGINTLRVTGSGADSTTIIYFQFQQRYIAL